MRDTEKPALDRRVAVRIRLHRQKTISITPPASKVTRIVRPKPKREKPGK